MCRDKPKIQRQQEALEPRNDLLGTGEWLNDIIWDAAKVSQDLFDDADEGEPAFAKRSEEVVDPKVDPYNVSNDHVYEHSREARFRIRQTFGAIEVFHSLPAKNLQMPFVSFTPLKPGQD